MTDPEHMEILKQGVQAWNNWREKNLDSMVEFSNVTLRQKDFSGANFSKTYFYNADLVYTNLNGADFCESILIESKLSHAKLNGTKLKQASVVLTDLSGAKLIKASFNKAFINGSNFTGAQLDGADFNEAKIAHSIFGNNDLSTVIGLDKLDNQGPSTVGIDTLFRSGGKIPETFLRGSGVPDTLITFARSLVNTPIDFYSCFISYSSTDQEFAERLHADLQAKGVRVWFAPHNLPTGARIRPAIDESIRLHDKLLLVLSEASVSSQWVEQEVETALAREREPEGKTVLFPVRIDDAVMRINTGWPAYIRNTRNVGDFTRWKEHDSYQKAFDRLLRDLKAET